MEKILSFFKENLFFVIAALAFLFSLIVILLFIDNFGFGYWGTIEQWGQTGDFFGGILNPTFTFLGFGFLIYTITQNKKMIEISKTQLDISSQELKLSREEMAGTKQALEIQAVTLENQRFENTFFNLLNFYEHCRDDVSYTSSSFNQPSKHYQGRDAFEKIFLRFLGSYLSAWRTENMTMVTYFKEESRVISGVRDAYHQFYEAEYGADLGQYFRVIYQILKLIDDSKMIENKKFYSNLLRAQLSRYELIMLYYNCLSKYGDEKMMVLVKKYEVLKHLELKTLPDNNSDFYVLFK